MSIGLALALGQMQEVTPVLPASLGTPAFRFRPDSNLATVSGGLLTSFLAVNGNSGSSVGTAPTYTKYNSLYAGRPTATFANALSPQGLTVSVTIAQPCTVIVVGSCANSGGSLIDGTGANRILLTRNSSDWQVYCGTAVVTSSKAADASPHAFALIANGTSSALYVDSSITNYISGNPGTEGLSADLQIGCSSTAGSQTITGDVAEVIFFSGAFSTAQIAMAFAYIRNYYSLNVS